MEVPLGEYTADSPGMGRIRLLADELVDQIAAGEVVERPASVVKELVENSLDAGAGLIRVDVREGGAALIAVMDDGLGMSPEELPLALQRHATSKLRCAADLERIASFGFRGEALPAIASVSRFRIRSRVRGAATGFEIACHAGKVLHQREIGGPEGTRVEVADLFGTVPARRKFLKRPGTEWGHVADWLSRLALVRPEIHLEHRRDERPVTVWPACRDPRDRIAAVLSDEDAAALIEVCHETSACRVHAFVSSPERTRANAQGLYLFVNGRPVRDRLLRHALLESYRDLLPRGRFPIAVLYLEVAPETVDVNVHPAKWEVRFDDPQALHRAIRQAVRDAMAGRSWLAGRPGRAGDLLRAEVDPDLPLGTGAARAGRGGGERGAGATGAGPRAPVADDWIFAGSLRSPDVAMSGAPAAGRTDSLFPAPSSDRVSEDLEAPRPDEVQPGRETSAAPPVPCFGSLRLLGQLRASYLLAEADEGLLVVDQHAAHERVLYERLRSAWLASGVSRQGLLTPVTVSLSPRAVAALEEEAEVVGRLGFEVEPFGEAAVLVRAIPAEMAGQDAAVLVSELAAALEEAERGGRSDAGATRWLPALDRLFATLACHSARRFGDRLPEAEQRAILEGLDAIPWAPTCPHGRPVAILLHASDLERRFRRS